MRKEKGEVFFFLVRLTITNAGHEGQVDTFSDRVDFF